MTSLNQVSSGHFEIILGESFDFETHKEFRKCVKEAMEQRPAALDINFAQVDYIDSSALGMLLLAKRDAEASNCKLRLTRVQDGHAKSALQLVQFEKMFTITD